MPMDEGSEPCSPLADPGSVTVLLADDECHVLTLATTILTHAGYRVLAANDGQEALDCVARHAGQVDLAVLDVVMPRMGGPEVLLELRKSQPRLPVVFCTGYSPGAITQSASGVITRVLPKPFLPGRLLDVIRETLERSRESQDTP